jgi:hypothetical protein
MATASVAYKFIKNVLGIVLIFDLEERKEQF